LIKEIIAGLLNQYNTKILDLLNYDVINNKKR
jgi:hypothetical protein